MFDDAIRKLLWKDKRGLTPSGEEGYRDRGDSTWRGNDPGWVFRAANETFVYLPRKHVRHAVETLVPSSLLYFVDKPWLVPLLLALLTAGAVWWSRRAVFYLTLITGLIVLLVLYVSGIVYLLPGWWICLVVLLMVGGVVSLIYYRRDTAPAEAKVSSEGKSNLFGWWRQIAPWIAPAALWLLSLAVWDAGTDAQRLLAGECEFRLGPIPQGTPINALLNVDPEAPVSKLLGVSRGVLYSVAQIKKGNLEGETALNVFNKYAGPALMQASKCPDFVLDRGHYFGETLSDEEKEQLIAFLKTL
jgi:hypothetical protein